MRKYLIAMVDGGLVDIKSDIESHSGCDTCDYGSEYINKFQLVMKDVTYKVIINNMYEYSYSQDQLIKVLYRNIDIISQMTQEEFCLFLKNHIVHTVKAENGVRFTIE